MSEFKTPVKNNSGEEITIPPSPFLNRLGYGTGVSVMQLLRSPREGQMRSPWALKMLNKKVKPNKVFSERLREEAEILQNMSHPNIVGFRAFSENKILYLGMEACDESLGDLIESQIEAHYDPFTPKQVLKVAVDIARALEYLHTTMRILHGDIKSYNVLVNGEFVICKLCDFGVTLPLGEDGVFDKNNTGVHYYGTEAWSAPEVFAGGEISHKTDVWPLGLTLWEMMALKPPHSPEFDESFHASFSGLDLSTITEAREDYCQQRYGTRPPPPEVSAEEYGDPLALFLACTEAEAERRPAAAALASIAADMMQVT